MSFRFVGGCSGADLHLEASLNGILVVTIGDLLDR